jgi:hypothetical protein
MSGKYDLSEVKKALFKAYYDYNVAPFLDTECEKMAKELAGHFETDLNNYITKTEMLMQLGNIALKAHERVQKNERGSKNEDVSRH